MSKSRGYKHIYFYLGAVVLIMMVITGWLSGVTLKALLIRASLASLFFTLLTWVVVTYIIGGVIAPPEMSGDTQPEESGAQPVIGTQLDVILPAEETVFDPFAPSQIDPRLTEVINEDPERIASMVKKMGLEED